MNTAKYDSFIELANLVQANISAPTKFELVQRAQERLIESLKKTGAITEREAGELLV